MCRPFSRQRFRTAIPSKPRKTKIEYDGPVILSVAAEPRLLTVSDVLDDISRAFKRPPSVGCDPSIVFNEQHAHHFSFSSNDFTRASIDIHFEEPG